MPLLEDEFDELGLGDWWRATFSQEDRGYVEWTVFVGHYFMEDERYDIPARQLELMGFRIAARYQATDIAYFLAPLVLVQENHEDFGIEEDNLEVLSPRELERIEKRIIKHIEAPAEREKAEREVAEREIRREIVERYKSSKSVSKAEAKRLDEFAFYRCWGWTNLSEKEQEKINREVSKRMAKYMNERMAKRLESAKIRLWGLVFSFKNLEDESISHRFFDKVKDLTNFDDVLALHDWYANTILFVLPAGDRRKHDPDPTSLDETIVACEKQITLAPEAAKEFKRRDASPLPWHTGYERLAIIREKQKDYADALRLATEAKEQGWSGDWDKRIERCKVRIQNQERAAGKQPRRQKV